MKKLLFFVIMPIWQVWAQNLISNGGFENGLNQWQTYMNSNAGTYGLETKDVKSGTSALRVQVLSPGANAWDIQTIHGGWHSVKNVSYTLTFYAKAVGAPSKVRIVQQNNTYNAKDFDIPTTWTQFSWTFPASEDNLQLKIHYFQAGTFLFDDFHIPNVNTGPKSITIQSNTLHQQMVGFGGALTWHCDRITRSSQKNEIAQLLFQDMGMDILRLKNWYYPLNYPNYKSVESMEVNWFVPHFVATNELAALGKQYNPNLAILLSSWGPPSALKSTGKLEGGTLKKNNGQFMYAEYAQYWSDILDHISFKPDFISIQNEPGYENPGWTTTAWRPTETTEFPGYDLGLDAVYNKLKTRSYVPKMIGPETENIGTALWDNSVNTFGAMATPIKSKPYLYGYAYHLYNFGNPASVNASQLNMIRDTYSNKPNFMTEFSSNNFDWLQTAQLIQQNLMEANTSSYIYWDLMWEPSSTHAALTIDDAGQYALTPYYHVLKHFAKYIDQGDTRVEVGGSTAALKVTGFVNPTKDKITLVITNTNPIKDSIALQLGNFTVKASEAYQSVEGAYFKPLGTVDTKAILEVPAGSITTLVLSVDVTVTSIEESSESILDFVPNPTTGKLFLGHVAPWTLLSLEGQVLATGFGSTIDLQSRSSGLYVVKTGTITKKIIKE